MNEIRNNEMASPSRAGDRLSIRAEDPLLADEALKEDGDLSILARDACGRDNDGRHERGLFRRVLECGPEGERDRLQGGSTEE